MKLKKVVATSLVASMCFTGMAFTSELKGNKIESINPINLHSVEQAIEGKIPEFTKLKDKALEKNLNRIVEELYEGKVAEAKKMESKGLNFKYEIKETDKYISVIIYTEILEGNTNSEDVTTIVVDKAKGKEVKTLVDLLGPNGYKLANASINNDMKKAGEATYFEEDGFKGTNSSTKFYLASDDIVSIIFNKYEIAPGSTGIPKFDIDLKDIREVEIKREDILKKGELDYLPLESTLKELGFEVKLEAKSAEISKGGKNYKLEEKDIVYKDDKAYIPLGYLETKLNIFYTLDGDKLTLTSLNIKEEKQAENISGDFKFFIGKEEMTNVVPVREDNVIMLPLRSITEKLGYEVEWNPDNKSATLKKDKAIYIVAVGTDQIISTGDGVQGTATITSAPADIRNGSLFVPTDMMEIITGGDIEVKGNSVILNIK